MKPALGGTIPETKTLTWPVWRDEREHLMELNAVVGEFACWAVIQSPYAVPDNLQDACWQLRKRIEGRFADKYGRDRYGRLSCDGLAGLLTKAFELVPEIMAWNEPKSGHGAEHVFVDRYSEPPADDDIIDLGALARNVAHSLVLRALADED